MDFTFGSDPEFFLGKDKKVFSAVEIVKTTKSAPLVMEGNLFYHDNVAVECAIKPGCSKEEVIDNFRNCFKICSSFVRPYKLLPLASYSFDYDQLNSKDALEVGCKEEWCAYELKPIDNYEAVKIVKHSNFRCAGGHIHLGTKFLQNELDRVYAVRMLDLFLAIPSILFDSENRKKVYGQAGRYRRPPHGLEYRTLSNFWLASPKLVGWVYDICSFVLDFIKQKKHTQFWNLHECTYDTNKLRTAIQKSDLELACEFMELVKIQIPLPEIRHYDFYLEWGLNSSLTST